MIYSTTLSSGPRLTSVFKIKIDLINSEKHGENLEKRDSVGRPDGDNKAEVSSDNEKEEVRVGILKPKESYG